MAAAVEQASEATGATPRPEGGSAMPFLGPRRTLSATPIWGTGETRPDEYVGELMDPVNRMQIFDEMRQGDPAINSAITTRTGLMRAANWVLNPADDSDTAKAQLEYAEDALYPFLDRILGHLGEAQQYGFAAIEPIVSWADRPVASHVQRGKVRRPTKGDRGRALYLTDIVHMRQRTVRSFLLAPLDAPNAGELIAVRQFAYAGLGSAFRDIPAQKLVPWTVNRRGDDYWGNPALRACYRPWTFKNQLERANLVGVQRFGAGIPVATAGPDWGDDDYARLAQFLETFQANNSAYVITPHGGAISVLTSTGQIVANVLEWIRYYDVSIHFQYLTHGTQLATNTQTGARALGDTFVEQASTASQADCEELASIINERLIRPLIDANFGPQPAYPFFSTSQHEGAVAQLLAGVPALVQAKLITWRPADEVWLRDRMEMPEVAIEELEQLQAEQVATAMGIADANGEDGSGDPGAGGDATGQPARAGDPVNPPAPPARQESKPKLAARQARPSRQARRFALSAHPEPAVRGETTHRTPALAAFEARVLKPDLVMRDLELASVRAAGEVQAVLTAIDTDLAAQVEALALADGHSGLAAAVSELAVPARLEGLLRRTALAVAQRVRAYAAQTVVNEVQRQASPDVAAPSGRGSSPQDSLPHFGAWTPVDGPQSMSATVRARLRWFGRVLASVLDGSSGDPSGVDDGDGADAEDAADQSIDVVDESAEQRARTLQLEAEVDRFVADEIARREAAAQGAARAALAAAPAATPEELAPIAWARAQAATEDLSTDRTRASVAGVVNVAFGAGRNDGGDRVKADAQAAGIPLQGWVYSAVMDGGTCEECAKWDGAFFPADYPTADPASVKTPNPRCAGGYNRCRCVKVFVTADEAAKIVGPAKGPVAVPDATADA